MKPTIILILFVVCMLRPLAAIYLVILTAPLVSVFQGIGWDPRIWCAAFLGFRAIIEPSAVRLDKDGRILAATVIFFSVAQAVLWSNSRLLPADEVDAAQLAFVYFVAAALFVFALSTFVTDKAQTEGLLVSFGLSVWIVAAYAFWQVWETYFGGRPDRIGSTLINPNFLAAFAGVCGVTLLAGLDYLHGKCWRIYISATVLVAAVTVILALSRAGLFAFVVGVMFWWALRRQTISLKKLIAAFTICGLLGLSISSYVRNYRVTIQSSGNDQNKERVMAVAQAFDDYTRWEAATYAMQKWTEHPILGIGFGVFPEMNYRDKGFYLGTHDTLIELTVSTGLFGLLLAAYILRQFWKRLSHRAKLQFFPIATCFLISSFFADFLQTFEILSALSVAYLLCFYIAVPKSHSERLILKA